MTIKRTMFGVLAAALIAGCSTVGSPQRPIESETIITATAVVESVDMSSREVLLRTPDGELLDITAGPEVRNLAQLEAGDEVEFSFYESIVVAMADPGEVADPVGAMLVEAAPEGEKPGALAISATDFVVEFISYNPGTAQATFVTPDGETNRVQVQPELRAFAETRRTGDRVRVSLTEAVAVTINETAN